MGKLAADALTAAGVPHRLSYAGNMFSIFFTDADVVDYDSARTQQVPAFKAFFHAMLAAGVYLPPSAFEAWFVSAAHRRRRPGADRRGAAGGGAAAAGSGAAQRGAQRDDGVSKTVVHVLRHGEVYNPDKILYGRLPGFRLSELGVQMAKAAAQALAERDVVHVVASPLERAQQTAEPIAAQFGLPVGVDERLIESANWFEGKQVSAGDGAFRDPRNWWVLRDPVTPSWGEAYQVIAERMFAALHAARVAAEGHEAVLRLAPAARSGRCAATSSASGSGTTRAGGSAGWPASPRSTSTAPRSSASATPSRPPTWSRISPTARTAKGA